MSMPIVSVIIPNYNRARFLPKVIESVRKQSYPNLEIIVVDDCSTDNSLAILSDLAKSYSNLKVFQVDKNRGANYCRNYGVKQAEGDYIAFLDSDDYFLEEKIEKQMAVLEANPQLTFVVSSFFQGGIHQLHEGPIYLKDVLRHNNLGGFSTLLVKKQAFFEVGGLDNDLPSNQDWDLYLKLLEHNQGYKLAENLVTYDIQEDSISKSANKVLSGYQIVSQRAVQLNNKYSVLNEKDLEAYQAYYLAMRFYKFDDVKTMRTHLIRSIKIKPSLEAVVYLILSLMGKKGMAYLINWKNKLTKS